MTSNQKSTRYYSERQEKKVAKVVKGNLTINSGAMSFSAGDVTSENWLYECKTSMSLKSSVSIKKEWLDKLKRESISASKNSCALVFNFGPKMPNYYVIDESTFKDFLELESNLNSV